MGRTRDIGWWLIPLLSALLTLGLLAPALWPVRDREFVLDDAQHLGRYAALNASHTAGEVVRLRHWQEQSADNTWRPVSKLLWRTLATSGLPPSTTVLTVVTLGLAAGIAATLATYLIGLFGPRWWVPLLSALPLVHPLSSDLLLPFVGQADLLAALFLVVALILWSLRGPWTLVAGSLAFLVATLCKESTFPAVLALPALLLFGAGPGRMRRRRAAVALLLASIMMAFRFLAQRLLLGTWPGTTGAAGAFMANGERPIGFAETVGLWTSYFLGWRIPQSDYSFLKQPGSEPGGLPLLGIATITVVALLLFPLLWRRRATRRNALTLRYQRIAVGGVIAAILFASLFLGIFSLGAIFAGRFAFLSMIFLTLPAGALICWTGSRFPFRLASPGTGLALCMLLLLGAVRIAHRATQWTSPRRLWEAEVLREPRHAFAWKNLAVAQQSNGELEPAWQSIEESVRLWPTFGEAWLSRAQIARATGRIDAASESFARARPLLPRVMTCAEEARFLASQRRFAEALVLAEEAARLEPEDAGLIYLRDKIRADLGKAQNP